MSTGRMLAICVAIGLPLGVIAGLQHWSDAQTQTLIAIATAILVPTLLLLGERHEHRRHVRKHVNRPPSHH